MDARVVRRPPRVVIGVLLGLVVGLAVSCARPGADPSRGSGLTDLVAVVPAVIERLSEWDLSGALGVIRRYPEQRDLREIVVLYSAGEHGTVTKRSDEFLQRYPLTDENFGVLLYKAASHAQRQEVDEAIASYRQSLPFIERLDNVRQRAYASVFFHLGFLYHRKGDPAGAVGFVEAGLRREPQNGYYQILHGELLHTLGQSDRAVKHFQELMDSSGITTEEKVVLGIKLDRLTRGASAHAAPPPDMTDEPFYPDLGFRLLPINHVPAGVSWRDICVLLESKWLVGCEVLGPSALDEAKILDGPRRQYDGGRVLAELNRLYPPATRGGHFLVAVTGKDIFGPKTNYVFSWQSPGQRVGVVSSYRFVEGWDDFYELDTIVTRRLGIQFISTTGSLLGITRPTKPDCPMAYPREFREFMLKGSRLCESTIQQRDDLLRRVGGRARRFGAERAREVVRVYRTYRFE